MFDPRLTPTAAAAMLADAGLRDAIVGMRPIRDGIKPWPFVEHLLDIDGRAAWAVDDGGIRYVVVGVLIWRLQDLFLARADLRTAATEAFARLDEHDKETT